jgi:dTDP-glucose 4,6-dehydratase
MNTKNQTLLITGGAGFIGSTLVRRCLDQGARVVTLDKFTYAGNRESLAEVLDNQNHTLVVGDIANGELVKSVLEKHQPSAIIHLAAETHVDRSIASPPPFATTNVLGTCVLLEATTQYWQSLNEERRQAFRFLNVSTDEVFGEAKPDERFTEQSPLKPNSPYAASKSSGEHFASAFAHTYGLPVITANPSNNYGPRQHPEKLIPKMILAAAKRRPLEIYGDGLQERDWLHVDDCCAALLTILKSGSPGERYLVGADCCLTNLQVVEHICDFVDEELNDGGGRKELIEHVADRLGHDRRYAVDASRLQAKTSWRAKVPFAAGLRETVRWYLQHPEWVDTVSARSGNEL